MKTILITGSTRGIGYGLAYEFAKHGCNVVICGRSPEAVTRAVNQIGAAHGAAKVFGIAADVGNYADMQALWDEAAKKFGRVDIWINNAGTTTNPLPFGNVGKDEIDAVISAKLFGTLYGTHVAVRGMTAQGGGDIYFVEGMGGKGEVQVGVSMLGTTNAAIVYLVKALRQEYAQSNVRFHTVRPGINVTEHFLHGVEHLDEKRWESSKRVINIIGDKPETTTPWLAAQILANNKKAAHIAWLTGSKIALRFLLSPFNKRDLFTGYERKKVKS